jgi:serine/threonine protein kinase
MTNLSLDPFGDPGELETVEELLLGATPLMTTEFCELFTVERDQTLVIKLVKAEHSKKPEVPERIAAQYQALLATNSDNVLFPKALLPSGGRVGYLLDYYPAGSLDRWLKANPLTDGMKLDFARQLIEGLSAMHQVGWTHGDLTAANVLMAGSKLTPSRWRLVIADPFPISARPEGVRSDIANLRRIVDAILHDRPGSPRS